MKLNNTLIRSLKRAKGETLTIMEKIHDKWYDLWHYTWGFSHIIDLWWNIRHSLWDRHDLIRTHLSKNRYHDNPELILYGMMSLVVDFIEVEKCFDIIDFTHDNNWVEVGNTLREVYDWWKDYPNRQKEIQIALDNWHDCAFEENSDISFLDQINNGKVDTPETKRYSKIHDQLEEKLTKEETEMIIKIVKIRDFMWT